VIVRLMGEGQYRLDDGLAERLEEIDEAAGAAAEAGDRSGLTARLSELHSIVQTQGERLDHTELVPSDLIVPPADLSLDEARALLGEEGLIPDLPERSA
jgi:PspA-Associated protein